MIGAGEIESVGPGVERVLGWASESGFIWRERDELEPPELRDGRAFGTAVEFAVDPSVLALDLPDAVQLDSESLQSLEFQPSQRIVVYTSTHLAPTK